MSGEIIQMHYLKDCNTMFNIVDSVQFTSKLITMVDVLVNSVALHFFFMTVVVY